MSISIPSDKMRFHFDSIVKLLVQASDRSDMMLSQLAGIRTTIAKPQRNHPDNDFEISPFQRLDNAITKNLEAIQAAHTLHEETLAKHNSLSNKLTSSKCHYSQSQCHHHRLIHCSTCTFKTEKTEVGKKSGYRSGFDNVSTLVEKTLQASEVLTDCIKGQMRTLLWDSPFEFRMKPRTLEMGRDVLQWFDFRMSDYKVFDDSAIQTSTVASSNSK